MKAPNPVFFALILILSLISSGCASIYAPYFTKDPLTAEEHNNLGVIYEREGKYDLAIREYKSAASADGGQTWSTVYDGYYRRASTP